MAQANPKQPVQLMQIVDSNRNIVDAFAGSPALGTGTDTALAINVGTTGSVVVMDGALGTPSSGTLTNCIVPASTLTGGFNSGQVGVATNDMNAILPIMVFAKGQAITTGAAHDICTIDLSTLTGFTRFFVQGNAAGSSGAVFVNETQTGTMATGTVAAFTTTGGGGTQLLATTAPAATSNPTINSWLASAAIVMSTTTTIVIRQMAASANTGTISFYIRIFPIPL